MHIHIENINVYINGDDVKEMIEGPVTFDIETTEDFPEEAAAAEEVLYEAQDEEVTPAEDYWDKAVDAAVKPTTFEPKSLVKVHDRYFEDEIRGKVGRVRLTDDNGYILVEFDGFDRGHDGDLGDGAKNRRWFFVLDLLEPYTFKKGDTVRHMGDGTGETFQDNPYGGYEGHSLVGKVGTVISGDYLYKDGEILIDWRDWSDGHNQPISQDKGSRWWTSIDNLNKAEQWNS